MLTGKVNGISGNMVRASFETAVRMNGVAYVNIPGARVGSDEDLKLKSEIIRIRSGECDLQVFEDTRSIQAGDTISFVEEMLSVELGPGLLSNVYDGLGNPLHKLAKVSGNFLQRGLYLPTLDRDWEWAFTPACVVGDVLRAGNALGTVPEGIFEHRIMVPFDMRGKVKVVAVAAVGFYKVEDVIATVEDLATGKKRNLKLMQKWPVKIPIRAYQERLLPDKPLSTKVRIVDSLFPIAEGGTACMPGPFGSGKTVFQQSVSRYGDADVVIVAACGERAGEVVETLREFPELTDPKTGKSLMERTIIICNTSSMPVAAREASVYTAATLGEYYRQMGLRVLVLADSTSRWAQALREMSGRLEEIPGEEAFPAYLGSLIAAFYERAGLVRLSDPKLGDSTGSMTIIGSVSPAGGNFEEPVTQSTLAVVGCFLGLTYARSYAKRFPAISPLESWSQYLESMRPELSKTYYSEWVDDVVALAKYYAEGQRIGVQMKVVGEEDLSQDDFVKFLKSEFIDAAFLQQNAFDSVDACPTHERTAELLKMTMEVVNGENKFQDKDIARDTITKLTSLFRDLNTAESNAPSYEQIKEKIYATLVEQQRRPERPKNGGRLATEVAQ